MNILFKALRLTSNMTTKNWAVCYCKKNQLQNQKQLTATNQSMVQEQNDNVLNPGGLVKKKQKGSHLGWT